MLNRPMTVLMKSSKNYFSQHFCTVEPTVVMYYVVNY